MAEPETVTDAAPGVVAPTPAVSDPASYAAEAAAKAAEETSGDADKDEGPKSLEDLEPSPEDDSEDAVEAIGEEGEGEAEEAEASDEDDETTGEDESADEEETSKDMLEFDFGGDKFQVEKGSMAPELAGRLQEFVDGTWKDYQHKSQANAETAKSLKTQGEALEKMAGLNGEALQTYSHGLQLRLDIEALQSVDLTALWQSDPDKARRISDTLGAKQTEFQQVVNQVGQHEQALDEAHKAETARRTDEGRAILDKAIPEFTTKHAPDVVKYAVDKYGMSQVEADTWAMNPVVTQMAFKAMMYDRMQAAKPPKAVAIKPAPAAPVKPMKSSGKTSTGSSDPDKMSMAKLRKHLDIRN